MSVYLGPIFYFSESVPIFTYQSLCFFQGFVCIIFFVCTLHFKFDPPIYDILLLLLYLVQVTHPDFKKAKDKVMFKKKEGVPEGLYM